MKYRWLDYYFCRYLPLISFVTTFIYLGLLRMIHLFGFPPLVAHVNAVQLIITLRVYFYRIFKNLRHLNGNVIFATIKSSNVYWELIYTCVNKKSVFFIKIYVERYVTGPKMAVEEVIFYKKKFTIYIVETGLIWKLIQS